MFRCWGASRRFRLGFRARGKLPVCSCGLVLVERTASPSIRAKLLAEEQSQPIRLRKSGKTHREPDIRFHSASSFEISLPPRQPFSTHLFLKHGSFQYFPVSFLKLLFFWSFTRDILSFSRFCPPSSKRTLSYQLFSWLDTYPYFSNLFPFPAAQSRCLRYAVLTVNPFPRRFASFLFFVLLACCFLSSVRCAGKIFDSSPCHLIFARSSRITPLFLPLPSQLFLFPPSYSFFKNDLSFSIRCCYLSCILSLSSFRFLSF